MPVCRFKLPDTARMEKVKECPGYELCGAYTEINLFAFLIKFSEGKENALCHDLVLHRVFVQCLYTPDSHRKLVMSTFHWALCLH